jgi:hypothetical protein
MKMEELLAKYWEIKYQQDILDKKMERVKSQLKQKVKEIPDRKFETKDSTVTLTSTKRTTISKKDVPTNIWEQYSVCTVFDMLNIRKKKIINK